MATRSPLLRIHNSANERSASPKQNTRTLARCDRGHARVSQIPDERQPSQRSRAG